MLLKGKTVRVSLIKTSILYKLYHAFKWSDYGNLTESWNSTFTMSSPRTWWDYLKNNKPSKCWKREGRKLAQNIDYFRETQEHFLIQVYTTTYPETRNFTINKLVQIRVAAINGNKISLGRVNLFNSHPQQSCILVLISRQKFFSLPCSSNCLVKN